MTLVKRLLISVAMLGVGLLARPADMPAAASSGVETLPTPAGNGSGMYGMTADGSGRAFLIWIEPVQAAGGAAGEHFLKFSTLDRGAWSPGRTIARGSNWFVNWADHPTIAVLKDGSLAAHWLVNNDGKQGSYGYGIRIAHSRDAGVTWREVFSEGTDNVRDYSGFVSVLPGPDGFDAVYLTPPKSGDAGGHTMTLSLARFGHGGTLQASTVVDPDTCTCCSTTIARTARGAIAAYRDHESGEIRDISIVREVNGRWTAPQVVHRDGWRINGCPTNGPVLAAAGERVAIAWFTAANDVPRVKVAFSRDAGERFAPPAIVDGGAPVGWPAVVLLEDGAAVVSWLESTGNGAGEIRLRRVAPSGALGAPIVVATAASGRSTGIPQMVRTGHTLTLAWRSAERVVSATVPIPTK